MKFIIFSEYTYGRRAEERVGCKDQADFSR
jgi:hypothetical protein